ncbi:hypothetical protein ACFL9T_05380 [Thermodesulfobacteriota bacterium]
MAGEGERKRFGVIAIEKGYITKEQFVEVMGIQIENETEGFKHKPFGEVLIKMGLMNSSQVYDVLKAMAEEG